MADAQKMTKTIEYVQPSPRAWEKDGELKGYFVTVNFDDNSEGSAFAAPSKVDEVVASLEALKDQPTEFDLKAKDPYNNVTQWGISGWPGKPAGSGGSGGGGRGGGGMSHSQAGYMAAASALGPMFAVKDMSILDMVGNITALGEALTQALFDRKPPAGTQSTSEGGGEGDSAAPASAPAAAPGSSLSLAQLKQLKQLVSAKGWDDAEVARQTDGKGLSKLDAEEANLLIEAWSAA